ncbi:hypothetical protein AMTR_s00019p00238770 [Amborella trichopoda]|uniref:Uncharacterized protein n=1 Tax=Amborella trichopoda TaxID=13333 RepID=W1PBT5_AMBTC|nr:hypothetical protein AMTR_s00019p00238770 [Amborella trichopoda]
MDFPLSCVNQEFFGKICFLGDLYAVQQCATNFRVDTQAFRGIFQPSYEFASALEINAGCFSSLVALSIEIRLLIADAILQVNVSSASTAETLKTNLNRVGSDYRDLRQLFLHPAVELQIAFFNNSWPSFLTCQ